MFFKKLFCIHEDIVLETINIPSMLDKMKDSGVRICEVFAYMLEKEKIIYFQCKKCGRIVRVAEKC